MSSYYPYSFSFVVFPLFLLSYPFASVFFSCLTHSHLKEASVERHLPSARFSTLSPSSFFLLPIAFRRLFFRLADVEGFRPRIKRSSAAADARPRLCVPADPASVRLWPREGRRQGKWPLRGPEESHLDCSDARHPMPGRKRQSVGVCGCALPLAFVCQCFKFMCTYHVCVYEGVCKWEREGGGGARVCRGNVSCVYEVMGIGCVGMYMQALHDSYIFPYVYIQP